jgi:hypothetical protein
VLHIRYISLPHPHLHTGSFAPDEDPEQQLLLQTVVLDVGGMKCGGCSAAVKSMLLKHPGVQGAAVNLLTESAAVTVRCAGLLGV